MAPYSRPVHRGGRVAQELTLHSRGVVVTHSRAYHPQTCGKVERFRTLKKRLSTQPRAATFRQLQCQLDTLRAYDNDVRPPSPAPADPTEPYLARPMAKASGIPFLDGQTTSGTKRSTVTASSAARLGPRRCRRLACPRARTLLVVVGDLEQLRTVGGDGVAKRLSAAEQWVF